MKKIFILPILILCLLTNSVTFASKDVRDLTTAGKIEELKNFKIVNCYEDGIFYPEKKITRAEFCKMVAVMLGAETKGNVLDAFSDVPTEHWANSYISFCYDKKLINGKTQNEFAPNDYIIYQDALKILVNALGYEYFATRNGGYPHGYVKQASELGITLDSNFADTDYITREIAADIIYDSLSVPLVIKKENGDKNTSTDEYIISEKTLLDFLRN